MRFVHSTLRFLWRLRWVWSPPALVLLILYFGRAHFASTQVGNPGPSPKVPVQEQLSFERHPVTIPILRPDGSPASSAILYALEPELREARVDADGIAHFESPASKQIRVMAYAPGCNPIDTQIRVEDGVGEPLQLLAMRQPEFRQGEVLTLIPRRLTVFDEQDQPLAGVLVLAREAGQGETEPWVAFSDEQGLIELIDTTSVDLTLKFYPPGLPISPATCLLTTELSALQTHADFRLPTARILVSGLPLDDLLAWKRLDRPQLLPLVRIDDSGVVELGPVPTGHYRLEVGEIGRDLELEVGLNRIDFRQP